MKAYSVKTLDIIEDCQQIMGLDHELIGLTAERVLIGWKKTKYSNIQNDVQRFFVVATFLGNNIAGVIEAS